MNRKTLEGFLDDDSPRRILIVGDLMLDRYVVGEVSRISPEAPIPVLAAKNAEQKLGGAGNVASNLRAMDADVDLVGVIGDDSGGGELRAIFERTGISTDGLVIDETRPTSLKTRMISGAQQMLRVDWEHPLDVGGEARKLLLERAETLLDRAQALVLSDYGKGVLTEELIARLITGARRRGIPVLVDPKGTGFSKYRGATLITPNRKEAEQALGRTLSDLDAVAEGARELIDQVELDAAVITLGAGGIYFRTKDGGEGREATRARSVFDVTGAGDTVVAHLALHLAGGLGLAEAVALANRAAGLVVARLGAGAVTRQELRAALRKSAPKEGKVLSAETLEDTLAAWREEGKRIVFTNGCFDIIHTGHVSYLRFARAHGDVLLVGINDDGSVGRLKGPGRPVNCIADRLEVLAAMEMVNAVIAFSEDTPAKIIERVTPAVLVKGEDWAEKGVVGREWVEKHGGRVVLAPLVIGRSTTGILERAREETGG
jgi:D-beta-D-heptose 7-phosphate kinase / D-beta-D-heptose 1-phosphate adenosyltransferase